MALSNPRTELTAANLEEAVYIIGGFTLDDKITDIVELYNSIGNTWVQNIKSLPWPLHYASAATYDRKIYIVREYPWNWITRNNLFIYDSDTNN